MNFYTFPFIFYYISKMASIEVKLMTSSSQARIQVVVSGTDLPANFSLRICMSPIPCLRLCPIRKQAKPAVLTNLEFLKQYRLNKVSGGSHTWGSPARIGLRPGNILVQILVTGQCGRRCYQEPVP